MLALPPWLADFDTRGAIFANEAPRPDETFLQLINGPVSVWAGHEADAALIPWMLELGPGR